MLESRRYLAACWKQVAVGLKISFKTALFQLILSMLIAESFRGG